MKRFTVMVFLMALFPLTQLNAQSRGYIIQGDTAYFQGEIKYNSSRPTEVEFWFSRRKREVFTADQLTEFGIKEDGATFKSFLILLDGHYQHVFLEQVEVGPLVLYRLDYGQATYYLKTDTLIMLERDNYLELIRNWNEACPGRAKQYKLVRYNKSSLANFVRDYNLEKCRNLPFLNFGVSLDYVHQALQLTDNAYPPIMSGASSVAGSSLNFALFLDQPLWKLPNFSLTGEIGFNDNEFTAERFSPNLNQDIKIEMSNIYLALGPRYTLNIRNFRPYFLAGGVLSRTTRAESKLLQANLEGQVITIEPFDQFVRIPDLSYGFTYGAGVQFFYTHRHFLALEFSGHKLSGSGKFSMSGNHLKLKVNL